MTYNFHIVNSSINLYNQLKIKNIKGKITFLMDNARIHHFKLLKKLLKKIN
jgi:hypothetical protein